MIEGARSGRRRVACAYGAGIGAPALFSDRSDLDVLRSASGDRGARDLLHSAPESVLAIPAPEASLDIDDEEDWARWRSDHGEV